MQQNLNQPQNKAVSTTEGPLLVLAGAGTGKTKVLTSRIINIVNCGLASPLEILSVTFTNKAAAEMRKRIGAVIGDNVHNLWIGTFHSIASKILRRHAEIVGLKSDFIIIDADDQLRLVKQILADLNIDTKQYPAKNYLNKISRAKDKKLAAQIKKEGGLTDDDHVLPKIASVFEIYQNRLKMMNAADFGDLLSYNLEIFSLSPETLEYYQNQFKYILVDEYQDTNNIQYSWLLKLADKSKNICAVGDDDQSIYSWRGANVANILRFEKDFEDAKIIRLEQNYRSTAEILRVADSVISKNSQRHGKTLWTDKKEGEKVRLYSLIDDRAEASFVTKTIQKFLQQKKYQEKEIAILVRAGYQTRNFEESLIKASVPYRIVGGMKFYERLEVKDSISYLRAASNLSDDLALSRIINTPKRGVGQTSVKKLYDRAKNNNYALFSAIEDALKENEIKGKAKESLTTLIKQLRNWNSKLRQEEIDLCEVTNQMLEESGYIKMWQAENTLESQGRLENIDEFTSSLADFDNITEFLEYVSLIEAKEESQGPESVSLMTVHGAKGLEFDMVFVPGLEDGLFPSGRSVEERNGEEEERRLFYVAITRAKKELILLNAKTRFVFGDYSQTIPSRFLSEIPSDVKPTEIGYNGEEQDQQDSSLDDFYAQNTFSVGTGSQFGGNNLSGYGKSKPKSRYPQSYSKKYGDKSSFGNFDAQINQSQKEQAQKSIYDKSSDFFGKRVFHQKFGYGKVISVDGAKVEIDFEKGSKKTLMKDFVSLA